MNGVTQILLAINRYVSEECQHFFNAILYQHFGDVNFLKLQFEVLPLGNEKQVLRDLYCLSISTSGQGDFDCSKLKWRI